ncbi:RyR domain-containing protein [Frankia sp. ACN1ag]|uniref:RyR domain-containing protein n=1 Tax=Frankia sp. ACN1ag TaxID=102891 RepID=UPI0006DCA954|nr:RyR domain-containing protein [Frankia sp. ACN1ag]KQC38578.1 RyR domain protein [Frankia sp. ACN1ag]
MTMVVSGSSTRQSGTAPAAAAGTAPLLDPGCVERMAQAIHRRYLDHELGKRHEAGSRPGLRPWAELAEPLREANRAQAAQYAAIVQARDWSIVSAGPDGDPFAFTDAEIEELARDEHVRWRRHKERQGYSYGPLRSDAEPDKRHPSMVDWEELTEEDRDRDRDVIRNMPAVLAQARLRVTRRQAAAAS